MTAADRRRRATTGMAALGMLIMASCGSSNTNDEATDPASRRMLERQSASASSPTARDLANDRWWWGIDLKHVPLDRVIGSLDADTSNIDQVGVHAGRMPTPVTDRTNVRLAPTGGCSPLFYLRYAGASRTLLCNRDQRTYVNAENELMRVAHALARRFHLDPDAKPIDTTSGDRLFAIKFTPKPAPGRAYSPVLDQILVSRRGNRVLLVVVARPDGEIPRDAEARRPLTSGGPSHPSSPSGEKRRPAPTPHADASQKT